MIKILIADDNKQITEVLKAYARKEGMIAEAAHDGQMALDMFNTEEYDILLLDIMMPKIDGFKLCKKIRQVSMVPIIMITAKGENYDRIMGLDLGADDYIVKPFSPQEVMARIRAIMRRVEKSASSLSEKLRIGSLELDMTGYSVRAGIDEINLTKKEFELLWTLADNKGKVFTRDNLLDSLWGIDYYGDPRTVDTHIKRLRSKLGDVEKEGWEIKTVRGVGYKFEIEPERETADEE